MSPSLLHQWSRVKFLPRMPPVRKVPIHQCDGTLIVVALSEVSQLMHDEVFEAMHRLLRKFEIQGFTAAGLLH